MHARLSSSSFILAIVAAGCQSGTESDFSPPADSEPTSELVGAAILGPETRLASNLDRVHFAFRSDGARFRAAHSTHDVATQRGVVSITPAHRVDGVVKQGTAIELETMSIRRGADIVTTDLRGSSVEASTGHLVLDRTDVAEKLQNFEQGVEQSWRFETAPAGMGDLTVQVAVAGHPYAGETENGLHFISPGNLGFRYSHATWIDANGVATPIKARWQHKRIEITVPEDILENSAYPAVLDPIVAPEAAVDAPVSGWTGASSLRSAVATSGSEFLVVWQDARNPTSDIYGTRLNAAGAVIDTASIAINVEGDEATNPAVAFSGGQYVVVWDNGSSVRSARVSTAGVVSAAATVGAGLEPEIASRGADALVVFRSGTDVRGAVSSGGAFGASFAVATGGSTPSVAANPAGDYLVTWSEGATTADLRGRFVTAAGATPTAAFDISANPGAQNDAATAFNGTEFVTVWSNNSAGVDIWGARITTAGVVSPAGGARLNMAAGLQFQPALACTTTGTCLATWTDRRNFATQVNDVYAQRLDASLAPIGADIAVASLADEQREPAVVAVGGDWRLSWDDARHGGTVTVTSAGVNGDGSLPGGSGSSVVRGNNREERPSIAGWATQYLLSWADSRNLGHDIFGVRFSGSGKLDVNALAISTATRTQYNPASSYDGTNYVTAWEDNRNGTHDIYVARTNTAGSTLDAGGVAVSSATGDQTAPAIASGGGVSLVTWQDTRASTEFDLYAALINSSGAVIGTDIIVCSGSGNQRLPAVAYDATNNLFLVTWHDNRSGSDRIYGARVTPAGAVLDSCGVPLTTASAPQNTTSVAAGGGQFLVAWTGGPDNSGDVYAARVSATSSSLTVIDAGGILLAGGAGITQREASVAFVPSPGVFVVSWTQAGDILAQVVRGNGTFDGAVFVISANTENEARSTVAAGGAPGTALIAYERDISGVAATRVVTRRFTFGGSTGGTCSNNAQCVSGNCVDGYCCDTACGNGDPGDCLACSVARGAVVNGTCNTITLARNWRCRGYADTFCDLIEVCNGVDTTCPDDVGRRMGTTCNVAGGGVGSCPANDLSGAPHVCQ